MTPAIRYLCYADKLFTRIYAAQKKISRGILAEIKAKKPVTVWKKKEESMLATLIKNSNQLNTNVFISDKYLIRNR